MYFVTVAFIYACISVCTLGIHTYLHTFILTYIHKYIHTYIHTYIHIYIHTFQNIICYISILHPVRGALLSFCAVVPIFIYYFSGAPEFQGTYHGFYILLLFIFFFKWIVLLLVREKHSKTL